MNIDKQNEENVMLENTRRDSRKSSRKRMFVSLKPKSA
jgi:hypothetical protein